MRDFIYYYYCSMCRSLEQILNDPSQEELLDRNAWLEILEQDDIFVDELILFQSAIEKYDGNLLSSSCVCFDINEFYIINNYRAGLKDIIHMIRFPLMPLSGLKYVKDSEILSEEDIVELQEYLDSGRCVFDTSL
jgi:hypothetical protein